ncbi:MAG: T9SS type A sorting domain-containing protein [Cytophagaceae bacterium]|jgi:hypothetical protein|nr:T9SS type A sorting domain-containing protein [Cytophagaceae bacterium]
MKYIFTFLFFVVALTARVECQSPPSISFDYDADGNMTAQYVVVIKSAEFYDDTVVDDEEFFKVEEGDRQIAVYPNPTKGRIVVGITPLPASGRSYMQLRDVEGKLLQTIEIMSEQTPVEITGASGVYLLHIYVGSDVSKWKIVKE